MLKSTSLRRQMASSNDLRRRRLAVEPLDVPQQPDQVRQARHLRSPSAADVIRAVAAHFEVPVEQYCQRRSPTAGRDLAAYLAHHHTTATPGELAPHFGLTHPDSVSNLTRRAAR